ncbi:uncharacterized protein ColSpa_11678 [Colletotrichum spaethianum]|uniref:Uncharacterized protein n=1 Tax=Colletotrichum spaethianum TaxID=700344 RepID=A0AA37URV9_9PEZI|nr:uncharacterized protein ColSpa_11678 [Colletotrichum spaethianum]GKT51497.1 hypothetical protein ColSpa_11678 [Colletotrichum spaethianum]
MRYHVGRACAVAGYSTLYGELNLLPDVSIAEEARDNRLYNIFEAIVHQDTRYAVMDDYTRTVNLQSPKPGCLNGDTAVRSTIVITTLDREFLDLLWKPLPRDLPTTNKDALIIAAVWDGNVDRYHRLRRSKLVPNEISAVVRGAYHHTPFARWLDTCLHGIYTKYEWLYVREAVNAQFVMNNDLSRVTTDTDGQDLPAMFWWPHMPHENTLREFVWRRPDFKHQVTLACIAGDYQELFDELQPQVNPSQWQWQVACQSTHPYYRQAVERRAAEEKLELFGEPENFTTSGYDNGWSRTYLRFNKDPSSRELAYMPHNIRNIPDHEGNGLESWEDASGDVLNKHMQLQMAKWATSISQTDEERAPEGMLYSSSAGIKRRKTPAPKPKKPKDVSSLDDHYPEDSDGQTEPQESGPI